MRAVAAAHTPVVSAIGHESDVPLLDLVADLAASTPTDAAKRIVPDLADELRRLTEARARARTAVQRRLTREHELMAGLPDRLRRAVQHRVQAESIEVDALRARGRRRLSGLLAAGHDDLAHLRARMRALSPQATLDRGYAVVRTADGTVVRAPEQAIGRLRIRVAAGEFEASA